MQQVAHTLNISKILLSELDVCGGTEFVGAIESRLFSELPANRFMSVGKPSYNVEVKVIDENGAVAPVNTQGELCIRGWPLFLEYKDQPELTAKVKDKEGWLHTGDMVSMDECGYIYVYGRMSNAQRWKVASNVIYSISIETVLLKNPYVRSAVVLGTDNGHGHDINYVIEPVPDSGLTVEDVTNYAKENMMSSLEWPVRVFFYTSMQLPMTSGSRPKVI
ncbi:acsf [Bugula neritina]|uniref:Medium-chain acyl-CoA ligase ACSF2, mitochondrial n=1 Tax=Bugula neritina TaxID=10212 RepID=A0A7J7JAA8_BUGNE|nr:acsf [Bugula neritina]